MTTIPSVRRAIKTLLVLIILTTLIFAQAPAPQTGNAHPVGSVKAVSADGLTITTDAGMDLTITVPASAKILRVPPGQKDLKGATAIQLSDVQPGDRALVRGTASPDGKSVTASSVIVMKQSDIARKQQQEREDWQRRGAGGLVTAVDPATGALTISLSPGKNLVIHTSKSTVIRRYAPDSVKFDDATIATLDQIKPGDQVRVRGQKNPDGTEMDGEEIVAGTFRNIAGTIASTDPANNTVTVKDLATKKPVTIKLAADSQLRELPAMMAQRLAMRLKGGVNPQPENTSTTGSGNAAARTWQRPEAAQAGGPPNGGPPGQGGQHGQPDFQQMLSRMPEVKISDLKKDEAVMIVATEGSPSSAPTAITLLTGVEPILTASPNDNRAQMLLSPWSLGGGGMDAAAQ